MRKPTIARETSERGAILIQVAIMILVLSAFSAFVLDYGEMWLGRRQAQNAADAGALAGATALGYDELAYPPSAGGAAYVSAVTTAQANAVLGQVPGVEVLWQCPPFLAGHCVTVRTYRDGAFGSATFPTYFAQLIGVTSQGVRATATALSGDANATDCIRPWAIPDRWIEMQTPGFDPTDTFDRYVLNGPDRGQLLANPDVYSPATSTDSGTGYTLPGSFGMQITLKYGNPSSSSGITPGWFLPVSVPRSSPCPGGDCYRDNIESCNGNVVAIGDYIPTETGVMVGPTSQGVEALIAQDPGATWNGTGVSGSCAPGCAAFSPRIVSLPVFSPDLFQHSNSINDWSMCPTGGTCVQVVNIFGFFVAGISAGGDVTGYLMRYPGILESGSPTVTDPSAFLTMVTLVQ